MNILFNNDELRQLMASLHTLTGIRANIFDLNGKDICLDDGHMPFCAKINACPEGHARCEACDARAARQWADASGVQFYRCHAGICEGIIPISDGSATVGFLAFGQYLDDSPLEWQWENTARTLDWYPGGPQALHRDFMAFHRYSQQEINAYAEILSVLGSYIRLKGMIQTTARTDLQKLDLYLNQHYMEKLSLSSISEQLHIGRTKLCQLAKELSGGHTLSYMITQRRVEAAKSQLLRSDAPIAAVAESVGISDYNYFSKVFRTAVGVTPSEFRKQGRNSGRKNAKNQD